MTSHDSEDPDNMIDLGTTKRGDPVFMNKTVFEADLPILIGHVQGNPYGGPAATSTAPPASPTGGASPATMCRR